MTKKDATWCVKYVDCLADVSAGNLPRSQNNLFGDANDVKFVDVKVFFKCLST